MEVHTSYDLRNYPAMDDIVHKAIGRDSDFSGAGFGQRDLGWVCKSEIEAQRIKRVLDKIGFVSEIRID